MQRPFVWLRISNVLLFLALLHDIICRTDDADAYCFDGISCYIPVQHLDAPSNISSDMFGIALYYVISIVAILSL
jgi:hypothetical protein